MAQQIKMLQTCESIDGGWGIMISMLKQTTFGFLFPL